MDATGKQPEACYLGCLINKIYSLVIRMLMECTFKDIICEKIRISTSKVFFVIQQYTLFRGTSFLLYQTVMPKSSFNNTLYEPL